MMRGIVSALGGLLALWLVLNVAIGGGLMHFRFWAPKYRDAQREVFEQSQSWVQGKVSHLTRLRLSYEGAQGAQREALRRTILTEAATVDTDDLPGALQTFIAEIESSEGGNQ